MIPRRHLALCLAAALGLPPWLAAAEDAKGAPPAEPHVLFMGADLSVQRDQKIYRVEDIDGSELKIHVGQQEVLIPTRRGPLNLQVNAGLKLAGTSVKLDQMQSGAAYTYEHDPMRKLQEAANNQMAMGAEQELADARLVRSIDAQAAAQRAVNNGSRNPAAAQQDLDNANAEMRKSDQQMAIDYTTATGDLASSGAGARRMKGVEGDFDAMEVSFKISSPVELDHPFMVILFKFHAPDAKPGVDGLVIHAQSLDPIDATPRYVRVLKGGLPVGFQFVDCAVHVYNRGAEVATNLSTKRVEMTRDETQQYIVMEFLGAHKGRTASAAFVHGTLSRPQRQQLAPDQLNRIFFAKVSKDGALLGAFADEDCGLRLQDAATLAALDEVFFTPALQQGKPVEGIVRMKLADI